jgi:hypothetical protein
MLGDKIDELTAKVTGTRVIAIEGGAVKASKWARLNGALGIGEWELDDAGNGRAQIWEWK